MTTIDFHPNLKSAANADALRWVTHDYYIDRDNIMRGPRAFPALLPEATTQPIISPHSIIDHTNANPKAVFWQRAIEYWKRADITGEAHVQLTGWNGNSFIIQAMPFNRRADCNYKANGYRVPPSSVLRGAISFECEDNGYPTLDQTPWSSDPVGWSGQVEMLISSHTALCATYGIMCTATTGPFSGGIDYHSRWKEWSIFTGKTCPGAARIKQMDYIRTEVARMLAEFGKATGWQCGKGFPS